MVLIVSVLSLLGRVAGSKRRHSRARRKAVILPANGHAVYWQFCNWLQVIDLVWTLPPGDADFSTRWRLIKSTFSRVLPITEYRSETFARHMAAALLGHWIRDDRDYRYHVDYVHVNPLKHGYVRRAADWPYSTLHRYVAKGIYSMGWCGDADATVDGASFIHPALLIGIPWVHISRYKSLNSIQCILQGIPDDSHITRR